QHQVRQLLRHRHRGPRQSRLAEPADGRQRHLLQHRPGRCGPHRRRRFRLGRVVSNSTYLGKGDGTWLDIFVEVGRGAKRVVIKGNTVSGNRGTASGGATSAAVQVTSAVEPTGTEVTVTGNTFLENYDGVKVGDASATQPDDSKVTVTGNRIVGSVHAAVAV